MNILDLSGKAALVTGAGQGVGRAIVRYLAAHGAAVAVNDFYLERAQTVATELEKEGASAFPVQADVSSFDDVQRMVAQAQGEFGKLDILVNNAGNAGADPRQAGRGAFWETRPENWKPWLGVNLYGVLYTARAAVPGMIERGEGGRVITIISDAGRCGDAGLEVYAAAKAGAAGFTRSLATSLGRYLITVNCVAIATTRTPAVAGMTENEDVAKRVLRNYTIRRFGEPDDVAGMVTFLASDASSWITGQTYPVNGGFSYAL